MTPEERYRRDPLFHAMVQAMLGQLRNASMTATEIREAAILAAQIHEMTTARSFFIPDGTPPLRTFHREPPLDDWPAGLPRPRSAEARQGE